MVNSKQKGGSFERLICEKLSRWIDPDSGEAHFWRSSMSGGRATVRGKKGKQTKSQVGDISALTPAGILVCSKFAIECKHLKNLKMSQALITGSGMLGEIWNKIRVEAKQYGKKPLLIARQNGLPIVAMLRSCDVDYFRMTSESELGRLSCVDTYDVVVFRFEDLMARKHRQDLFT